MNRYADMWRDAKQTPREEAVSWIEHVMRFKRLNHLKIEDGHLNFFQYFCLDVIAFLAAIFCIFSYSVFRCLRARFFSRKSEESLKSGEDDEIKRKCATTHKADANGNSIVMKDESATNSVRRRAKNSDNKSVL